MKLILKLALRELKNSKKFCLFFILNLSFGILGFLVLHSFKTSVNESLGKRAKLLLASDISVSSRKPLDEIKEKQIASYIAPFVEKRAYVNSIYSMAQSQSKDKKSRLVQLKMISDNFPLYGEVSLKDYGKVDNNKKETFKLKNIWISNELSHQLKVVKGDSLKLGKLTFVVDDIIKTDTTSSSQGISLAPKLYVHYKYKNDLGLISQGSVVRYTHQFKLNPLGLSQIKTIQKELLKIIDDKSFKVLLPENSSEQVGRVLNYLSDYLGLVSLVAIFLATIGAAFLFQDFVFRKIVDIAILKSLGLTTKSVFHVFIIQLFSLGFLSVLLSSTIGAILLPFGSKLLTGFLGVPVSLGINSESIIISFFIALLLTFLICFPIVQKLLSKKTSNLFGGEKNLEWNFVKKDILKFIPLVIAIEALSVWQAHSFAIGSAFSLILILSSLLLFLIVPSLLKFINLTFIQKEKLIKTYFNIEFGLSLRFLSRGAISSTLTFLSIAIGVMLLSIISQLEVSLNKELLGDSVKKPSLFMFDIQSEQKKDLVEFCKSNNIPLDNLTPMVRARIAKVDGVIFKREEEKGFQTREEQQRVRFRNRGVNLTYSNHLNSTQSIIEGKKFSGSYSGEGLFEISLENRYAKRIGASIDSIIVFDILGVEFEGKVTSIRKVRWASFLPNFFITLQEGVVEDAPQSFLGIIGETSTKRQLEIQDLIVDKFSNVSMINVVELLDKITAIFESMSLAIKVMAYLCILVGFFVVFAIIQNQLRKKQYDILLLKSFGMTEKSIIKVFLYQFLKISFFATIIGSALSLVVGNLLSQVFFEGVWSVDWMYFLTLVLVMCFMTVVLVLISASSVYKKPIRSLLE